MKNKKYIAAVLSLLFILVAVSSCFYAFGNDVNWNYDETSGVLHIYGSGNMDDYNDAYSTPWSNIADRINKVVIDDGITSVGNYAFSGFVNLTDVQIADTVTLIGSNAFAACPKLMSLSLSSNVVKIKDVSFAMDGIQQKDGFTIFAEAGSAPISIAYKNDINFVCNEMECGTTNVYLRGNSMIAYYPYTAKVTADFRFYSTGNYDTIGYVYEDSDHHKMIAYNDDAASSFAQTDGTNFGFTVLLEKGKKYYFAVENYDPNHMAKFPVILEPVSFTVNGSIYAMNSPDGDASDILLSNATMNSTPTDGTFTYTFDGSNNDVVFECDGVTIMHTFSADKGDSVVITMMMCDLNRDGIVNAKDYAMMVKTASPYQDLFQNFMNYRY